MVLIICQAKFHIYQNIFCQSEVKLFWRQHSKWTLHYNVIICKLLWKPLYMIYDSPLWAFKGKVIPEAANFKEEALVTLEGWETEKEILKICWSMYGIEPITMTESADFGFIPLLWLPQGPQGCLEKQNHPLSSNLVVWNAKIGPKS